jgi:hypothetical protein
MKKLFLVTAAIFLAAVLTTTTAFAGWSQWYNVQIPAYESSIVGFYPMVAGDHAIQFQNDSSIYSAGYMSSYWGSTYDLGVWHWWADSDVFSYAREQALYAGSSDILFRFIFHNTTGSTHTFYYRFYTDN